MNKQNRDILINTENRLMVARGKGQGVCRNYYKGHMDKIKEEGGGRGGRWIQMGWGGRMGRKCRQL